MVGRHGTAGYAKAGGRSDQQMVQRGGRLGRVQEIPRQLRRRPADHATRRSAGTLSQGDRQLGRIRPYLQTCTRGVMARCPMVPTGPINVKTVARAATIRRASRVCRRARLDAWTCEHGAESVLSARRRFVQREESNMQHSWTWLRSIAAAATLVATVGMALPTAWAQQYPNQDIHFICAFPPGSGADVL